MKRLVVALGIAALASLTLSAQRRPRPPAAAAAKPAPSRTERTVPFRVGESLTYDVSWSTYLTAGTAITTVKEKRSSSNSMAYYIVAEARPTPLLTRLYSLYYKVDTLLDAYTLLPQRGSIYSEEGKRHRYKITSFDHAANRVSFEFRTGTTVKDEFSAPPYVQDALSALYVLRAIPFKASDRMTMPLSDNGMIYKLQVEIAASEVVKTPFGETRAWKLSPTIIDAAGRPQGRGLTVWVSDDPRRLPVKLQAELPVGSFVLALREAR